VDPESTTQRADAGAVALSALTSLPGVAILIFDRDFRYVIATGEVVNRNGWSPQAFEGQRAPDVLPSDRWDLLEPLYEAALRGESSSIELEWRGGDALYLLEVTPWRDQDGEVLGGVAVARDVTASKQTENELRETRERFELAFEDAPIGMALIGLDGRWLRVNRRVCEITGYPAEQLLRKTFQDMTHPEDLEVDLDQVQKLLDGEIRDYQMEKRYLRADQSIVWIMLSVSVMRDAGGEPLHFVSQIEDISERKRMEKRLRWLADSDALTGVRNRRLLEQELYVAVKRCQRYGDHAALLLLDLDELKQINDTHGHKVGDDTLRAVARAIKGRVRGTDSIARLGGDEFAVLMPHADRAATVSLMHELAEAISACAIRAGGQTIHPTASIGYALIDENTADDEAVLIEADRSMYASKDPAGGRPG
jgi:diguanylate cyclase (GGDEF)-like protein/PAS domain S-box-containing protein